MRLTISLDDDLYAAVKSLAKSDDVSMSAAVNLLLRRSVFPQSEPLEVPTVRSGLLVVDGRKPVTAAEVRRLEEEFE